MSSAAARAYDEEPSAPAFAGRLLTLYGTPPEEALEMFEQFEQQENA